MSFILLDFGGTIDTDGTHWSEKFRELYAAFNLRVSAPAFDGAFIESEAALGRSEEIRAATFRRTLELQLNEQFRSLKLDHNPDLITAMAASCYNDVAAHVGRASAVLSHLSAWYNLGLISNFYGNLEIVCREFGLDRLFSVIIDSAIVGLRKPDPAMFQLAIDRFGEKPAHGWMVGDSYSRDIVPAKRVGLKTVWLKGKSWKEEPESGSADAVIRRFAELSPLLQKTSPHFLTSES